MPREISEQQIRDRVASFSTNKNRLDYIRGVRELRDSGQIVIVPTEEESSSYFPEDWLAYHPEPAAELPKGTWGEFAEDPVGRVKEMVDVAYKNRQFSAGQQVRDAEQILQDPKAFLKMMGQVAAGIGLGGPLGAAKLAATPRYDPRSGEEPTNRQMAQTFIEGTVHRATDPQAITRDPIGFISTLADIAMPFKPKSTVLRLASNPLLEAPAMAAKQTAKVAKPHLAGPAKKVAEMARPLVEGAKSAALTPVRTAGELAAAFPAFATGEGSRGVKRLARAGYEGKEQADIAKKRMRMHEEAPEAEWEGLAEEVVGRLETEKARLGDLKDAWADALDAEGVTVSIKDLKDRILGENSILSNPPSGAKRVDKLRDLRIRVYRTKPKKPGARTKVEVRAGTLVSKKDRRTLKGFLREIDDLPDNVGVGRLDEVYKVLAPMGFGTQVKANTGRAVTLLRKELEGALKGFGGWEQAQKPLSAFYDMVDNLSRRSRVKSLPKGLKKTNITSLGSALERTMGRSSRSMPKSIRALEKMFPDLNLETKMAGQAFSEWLPKGLIGRGGAATAASGYAGYAAGSVLAGMSTAILSLAVFSPRLVGEALLKMGASARMAEKMVKIVTDAKTMSGLGSAALRGMTVGQLFERVGIMDDFKEGLGVEDEGQGQGQRQGQNSLSRVGNVNLGPVKAGP